jgi:hypothetical protein
MSIGKVEKIEGEKKKQVEGEWGRIWSGVE